MKRHAYGAMLGSVVAAAVVGVWVLGPSPAQAQVGTAGESVLGAAAFKPINTGSRAAVRDAVLKRLRPALAAKVVWDGSTSRCRAGAPSAATQTATLKAINFYRAMGQLDPVKLDAKLSSRAQKAALIMDAENSLSHFPPRSWNCWTKVGATAAGSSNLCLSCTGAESIAQYMIDPGAGNKEGGHRRWVMYPYIKSMGSGVTTGASALWVIPPKPVKAKAPSWVSWPTPGYFPNELEPGGRWSLSASNAHIDFGKAKVSVRTATGTKIKVQQYKPTKHGDADYGTPALIWQVGDIKLPSGSKGRRIDVTVTGIRVWNSTDTALTPKKLTRKYSVRFFNADVR
jgi:uncharacterized protein YkwD